MLCEHLLRSFSPLSPIISSRRKLMEVSFASLPNTALLTSRDCAYSKQGVKSTIRFHGKTRQAWEGKTQTNYCIQFMGGDCASEPGVGGLIKGIRRAGEIKCKVLWILIREAQSTHQEPGKAVAAVRTDGRLLCAISIAAQDGGAGAHSVQAAVKGAGAVLLCGALWLQGDATNGEPKSGVR